jgi:hypothetical protein
MDACMIAVYVWGLFTWWEYIGWLCGGGERMELMMRKYQQQRRAAGFTSGTRRSSLLFSYCRQTERERDNKAKQCSGSGSGSGGSIINWPPGSGSRSGSVSLQFYQRIVEISKKLNIDNFIKKKYHRFTTFFTTYFFHPVAMHLHDQ